MTQVLAGAIGGLLALLGVYVSQLLATRSARRDRLAQLGAQFLTHGAMAADHLSLIPRFGLDESFDPRVPLSETPHMSETSAAGVELSLLGGKTVAFHTQAVSGELHRLMLMSLPDVPREAFTEALIDFGAARLQLMQALRSELGRPVLGDDDLGHDAPDISDPKSTHTPR